MTQPKGAASLRPSEHSEGGGAPVGNLSVLESRFVEWDYDGNIPKPALALRWKMRDDDGNEYVQHYSAGDLDRLEPSEDGKYAVATGVDQSLKKTSNASILITETINAGFPEEKVTGDASVFDGLYAYFEAKAQPKRAGLATTDDRVRMITVPTVIMRLPWEEDKEGGGGGSDSSDSGELSDKAIGVVEKFADGDGGGEFTRKQLAAFVFKEMKKDPDRNGVAQLIFSEDFESDLLAAGFAREGDTITRLG